MKHFLYVFGVFGNAVDLDHALHTNQPTSSSPKGVEGRESRSARCCIGSARKPRAPLPLTNYPVSRLTKAGLSGAIGVVGKGDVALIFGYTASAAKSTQCIKAMNYAIQSGETLLYAEKGLPLEPTLNALFPYNPLHRSGDIAIDILTLARD